MTRKVKSKLLFLRTKYGLFLEKQFWTSKLIDGTFPDYERVIPSEEGNIVEIGRDDLKGAVDRVAAVSTERARAVKLSLEGEALTLSVNNPESGQRNPSN